MLASFSPALAGPKLNLAGVAKFEKNARIVPEDARWRAARYGPFLYVLTEKLSPKEKQALVKATEMAPETSEVAALDLPMPLKEADRLEVPTYRPVRDGQSVTAAR